MTEWYYARNGQQQGPVSLERLQELARSGQLDSADLVWNSSMTDWMPAGQAAGVFPAVASPSALNPYAAPQSAIAVEGPAQGFQGYAGFGWRLLAALIDGVVTSVAGFVIGLGLGLAMAASDADPETIGLAGQVVGGIVGWLYFAIMESSASQGTLGKMALGIKVTDLQGNQIGFARATGRYFGKIVSAVILLIGYFMCLFTEKKQCLHDLMAGCLVVRK